jgi:polyisoprenoid-binding protein YceI
MTAVLTRRWQLVAAESRAGFAVRNLAVRTVRGQVPISSGWADVDASGRPVSVHAELDLTGIATGITRRDRDLRKPRLLATERFPSLAFTSGLVERDEEGWQLHGRLAAHGAEIDVVLAVSGNGGGRVHATTAFDRRDLGIRAPRLMIGHRIDVTIDAVLTPAPEA